MKNWLHFEISESADRVVFRPEFIQNRRNNSKPYPNVGQWARFRKNENFTKFLFFYRGRKIKSKSFSSKWSRFWLPEKIFDRRKNLFGILEKIFDRGKKSFWDFLVNLFEMFRPCMRMNDMWSVVFIILVPY